MKKLLLLSLISLFVVRAFAQDIKFLKATEQHWVGGVCCSYGTNYIIYLESTDTINFIHFDTVWIGDRFFAEGAKNNLKNFKIARKGKTTYTITASSSWRSNNDIDIQKMEETSSLKPPRYKGKGCLVYYAGKQRKIISIPEFVLLSTLAYP
jgi:hypothetical protein